MTARPFLGLLAGLLLGSGIAWSVHRLRAPGYLATSTDFRPASASASEASGYPLPAPGSSLVLPPLLAATEADAALDAYLALPPLAKDASAADIQDRLSRLRALLTLLPDSHFERLFATLATRVGDAEAQLRRAAFEVWTEHDSPAAARWAIAIIPGDAIDAGARARYVSQAAIAWSRDDFTAAYAWSGALADAALRRDVSSQLLGQLASKDPQQALALAQAGDEEFAKAAKSAIFRTWAERDPAAALQRLGSELWTERNQSWQVQQAVVAWMGRDPKAALDWAIAQPVPEDKSYRSLLNNIGWNLAQKTESIRPVIDLIAGREDFPGRNAALQRIFGAWTRNDGAAALAWLDTVTDVAQRSDLVSRSLGYIETGKLDDFMALVQKLPDPADRDQKISDRLSRWAKEDPDAALDWLGKHDGPELATARRKMEGALIGGLARTDLNAALARWQALPADSTRGETAIQLAANWAKTDPAAATRWLAQQVPPTSQNLPRDWQLRSQMESVASGWARKDPLAYLAWAETLPDKSQRDHAINAVTNSYWFGYDERPDPPPRAAYANQLAQVQDPAIRERILSAHLSTWLRSDVQAARAWIESSDALSPEAAARLLTQSGANY